MTNFLTVKEAAKRTGKSPSSIRRIIYPILEDDKHPDRHHIEPDVKEVKAFRVKGENFAWKLSEELLQREVPEGSAKSKSEMKTGGTGSDQAAAIVEILRKQLDIKDQQIAAQNDVIKGLSERVREGNILMGSLQQQLSLSDGSSRKKSDAMNAETNEKREEGTEPATKKAKETHWLFRKLF
jgi:hypothetical protein